jgi:hypothetical protein
MATNDLISLLFTQILKIDPSTLYRYTNVQDQLLYLLLIPHVILFLFLYAFSFGTVRRIVGEHKGFSYLLGISSYIYIIYAGWYGKLVLLFLNWMVIALGLAVFVFFFSIILSPAATPAALKFAKEAGKETLGKSIAKNKEKEAIEEEVKALNAEIRALDSQMSGGIAPQARVYMQFQRANLEAQKRRLESRL